MDHTVVAAKIDHVPTILIMIYKLSIGGIAIHRMIRLRRTRNRYRCRMDDIAKTPSCSRFVNTVVVGIDSDLPATHTALILPPHPANDLADVIVGSEPKIDGQRRAAGGDT